jgi:FkbM family methyltransferase
VVLPRDLPILYEQEFLSRFLREFQIDLVFDVGANAGQYASMLRRRAGYRGAIVSFEPVPELAALLRRLSAPDPDWYVEEVALSDYDGTAMFNVMSNSEFSSLLDPSDETPTPLIEKNSVAAVAEVKVRRVGGYIQHYRELLGTERAYLKLDTQGNDLSVVRGAAEGIRAFVGLQSELAITRLYRDSPTFAESIALYEQLGFSMSAIFPNNTGNFPDMLEMDCVMFRKSDSLGRSVSNDESGR